MNSLAIRLRALLALALLGIGAAPAVCAATTAADQEPPRFLDPAHAPRFTPAFVTANLRRLAGHYLAAPAPAAGADLALWQAGLAATAEALDDPALRAAAAALPADASWPERLPVEKPDRRIAARMSILQPIVTTTPPAKMWTDPQVGEFSSFGNRRIMRSEDPFAAALVVAATAWAIDHKPAIRTMVTDLYRAPAIHGWLRLQERIGPDGALRDAPADPTEARRLAGAVLLAGARILPFTRSMLEPMGFTRSEAYLRDVASQRERLASPPTLSRDAVTTAMRRATEWQHTSLWNISGASDSPDADTSWYRGVFYIGLLPAYHATGDAYYLEKVRALSERTAARPGLAALYAPDCLAISQVYLDLHAIEPRPELLAPTRDKLDEILTHRVHRKPPTNYIDQVFCSGGTWTRMAATTGEVRYLDYAKTFWKQQRDLFRDPAEGLFVRDETWLTQPDGFQLLERNGRKVYWGRGGGWAIGGLCRLLDALPAGDTDRPAFEADLRALATALVKTQPADGLWRASLGDPESYPLGETSGTALIAYGLFWGINHGVLDPATFRAPAERALAALLAVQEKNGKLGYVQPGAESPRVHFYRGSNVEYATGAYLLAGAEWLRLTASPLP
jgi:rhamnogalacturonyl hydrolase YesR